jgi:Glutathione-dependent formaldehyde-activating enzyme
MAHIEGGCLCGRVRYGADADPAFVGVCHCNDCQKFTGSAFATVVAVPAAALKIATFLAGDARRLVLLLDGPNKFKRRRRCNLNHGDFGTDE